MDVPLSAWLEINAILFEGANGPMKGHFSELASVALTHQSSEHHH